MEETKYFTKQLLIEYNNAAIRERRNQAIKEEFLKFLPESFLFPVVFEMYHAKNEMRVQISFFDKGLIKIRPDGMVELRSSKLGVTFDKILYPKNKENCPSIEFLREKYEMDS